jgi:hypothetical protein
LFTRQTLFAAPLAVFGMLWFSSKRNAIMYLGILVGFCMLILTGLIVVTRGEAWNHLIVYNVNEFRWFDVWLYLKQWFNLYTVWGCVPLVILLMEHPWNQQRPDSKNTSTLLFWYTLFSFGEGILCGKIGSAPNYWLSFIAAASVGVGTVYHSAFVINKYADRDEQFNTNSVPMFFILAAFVFQLMSSWHWPHTQLVFSYTPNHQDSQIARLIVNDLRRVEEPVLSDRAGAALLAGHEPVYEPFICTQLVHQGFWDQKPLLQQIQNKEFSRIVLQFDIQNQEFDRERFTDELIYTIRQNYLLMHNIGTYYFYKAKE